MNHMRDNLQIFDFELESSDMELLLSLDRDQIGFSGEDSDLLTFS